MICEGAFPLCSSASFARIAKSMDIIACLDGIFIYILIVDY